MIGAVLSQRYEITGEIGRGGMGVVYRAHDPMLRREVAIKLIPPAMLSPDAERRFLSEAQLVAQMDHPAIVQIFDLGRHEDSVFYVMPVIEGDSLRRVLSKGELLLGEPGFSVMDGEDSGKMQRLASCGHFYPDHDDVQTTGCIVPSSRSQSLLVADSRGSATLFHLPRHLAGEPSI